VVVVVVVVAVVVVVVVAVDGGGVVVVVVVEVAWWLWRCSCGCGCICGCRPSCRCFLQVLETSPCRGGSAEFFLNDSILFHFCREEPVGAESEFPAPCRSACTASPRHCTDPPRPR